MSQVLFDTQNAVEDLKRGGFSDDQAKANVRFVREALEGGVATKRDLENTTIQIESSVRKSEDALKGEMQNLDSSFRKTEGVLMAEMQRLQGDVNVVRAEMGTVGSEMNTLRSDMNTYRSDMNTLRSDMRTFRFQILAAIAGATGVLGLLRFLT